MGIAGHLPTSWNQEAVYPIESSGTEKERLSYSLQQQRQRPVQAGMTECVVAKEAFAELARLGLDRHSLWNMKPEQHRWTWPKLGTTVEEEHRIGPPCHTNIDHVVIGFLVQVEVDIVVEKVEESAVMIAS